MEGRDQTVTSFREMFNALGQEPSADALENARQSSKLYEGRTILPLCISDRLKKHSVSEEVALIRCWDPPCKYAWSVPLQQYLEADDLIFGLPHRFGEFEVSGEKNIWYLRIQDDDPVVFLAGGRTLIEELGSHCASWVLMVPRTMKYP